MRYTSALIAATFSAFVSEAYRYNSTYSPVTRRMMNTEEYLATYAWNQAYYAGQDPTFIDFFESPEAEEYNRGDVYLNVADASNLGQLSNPRGLARLILDFREASGSDARFWLFYAGGGGDDKKWAPDFVRVFKEFILRFGRSEMGRLGLSYNVGLDRKTWCEIFDKVDNIRNIPRIKVHDIKVDVTLNYRNPDKTLVDKIMYRSDHVTVETFNNTYEGLRDMFKTFLLDTCPPCNTDYYCNYNAQITFLAEGNCETKSLPCSESSMCAYYSSCPEDPNGGIRYAYDQLTKAFNYIPGNILPQYRFDHFFKPGDTHFGLNFFEWTVCYYGYESWYEIDLPKCGCDYFPASQKCRNS
ncbi:hypothetical protein FOZ60_016269 [Perkinsus olseni]|uniref:Uncharacterized protein n=1 Tax=Perkinsus olseni TaxID=32597 RepID=A0A7J6N478_PEROL|nr:hypothetical protein FOZ60_016269 [Perkinsus olseni]